MLVQLKNSAPSKNQVDTREKFFISEEANVVFTFDNIEEIDKLLQQKYGWE